MSKETFYKNLMHTELPIEDIFESYPNDDYPNLLEFVMQKVSDSYAFPENNPEMNADKPMISAIARHRFSIFCRTLDNGVSYTKARLEIAKEFMAKKNSEVLG